MKPSPFSSASTRTFGATRFSGKPFWIDAALAEKAGATIHETSEIIDDLDRILRKTKDAASARKVSLIKDLVAADAEVLVRGNVPAAAVKGPMVMAGTRVLQGVQVVDFTISAYNLYGAGRTSVQTHSVKPIGAEVVRQVGGWGAAWAGMKLGGSRRRNGGH